MGAKETIWYLMDRNQLKYAVDGSGINRDFLATRCGRGKQYFQTMFQSRNKEVYIPEEVADKMLTALKADKADFVKEVVSEYERRRRITEKSNETRAKNKEARRKDREEGNFWATTETEDVKERLAKLEAEVEKLKKPWWKRLFG